MNYVNYGFLIINIYEIYYNIIFIIKIRNDIRKTI